MTQRPLARYFIGAMLILVGLIHLLPLSGALSGERLTSLYGLTFSEPNLAILMRHRAALFGMLGMFLIVAAFRPTVRTVAFIAGLISVVSFLLIAATVGNYNDYIRRVVTADVAALVCLVAGFAVHLYAQHQDVAKHRRDLA